jgi:drug/metabolite transporter (DMT)-like permease
MTWVLFSFLSALSEAVKNFFSKKTLQRIDEYTMAWALRFFALLFLIILLFFITIPPIDSFFYLALLTGGAIDAIASVLFMKSIKISPLSLVIPLVAFTPLFIALTAPFITGEFPSKFGFFGILFIVFGAYWLNIAEAQKGFFEPAKALLKEKGCLMMIGVAFMWGISSNIDKIGVLHSSPTFWVIASTFFLSIILFLPIIIRKSQNNIKQISINIKPLILIGLLSALELIFQMNAIKIGNVSYVISIKFTSIIISVLFGYFLFKEREIKSRLTGAILMIFGIVLIVLFGN